VVIESLSPAWLPEFLHFLAEAMPPDWLRHARELLLGTTDGRTTWDQVTIALAGERILGYSQFVGHRFGPFGVREELRGQGLGSALLGFTLERMRRRGCHCAWFLWTGEDAARLYRRFGFRESRRFTLYRKDLQ
jgi:GNAT superfamily N-acetyltransferase